MKALRETMKMAKECDEDYKWYPLLALEIVAGFAIWCYIAWTCGPTF